jgi:hypothetical protein
MELHHILCRVFAQHILQLVVFVFFIHLPVRLPKYCFSFDLEPKRQPPQSSFSTCVEYRILQLAVFD